MVCPSGSCPQIERPTTESICDMGPCQFGQVNSESPTGQPTWFFTEWTQQVQYISNSQLLDNVLNFSLMFKLFILSILLYIISLSYHNQLTGFCLVTHLYNNTPIHTACKWQCSSESQPDSSRAC